MQKPATADYMAVSRSNNNSDVWVTGLGLPFPGTDGCNGVLTANQRTKITAIPDGRQRAEHEFGAEAIWFDYRQYDVGVARELADRIAANPRCRFVLLANHGLFTWADTSEECYRNTLEATDRPGTVRMISNAGRIVAAVVCTAPDTIASAYPASLSDQTYQSRLGESGDDRASWNQG